MITPYEIRKWRRLKRDKGLAFVGELYYNGLYQCDCTLATELVTELNDRFILETVTERYTLMKGYEQK